MSKIHSSEFAYLMGNFMADGSFYKDSSGYRFEFTDGSSYYNELNYSLEHLSNIRRIIERFLNKKLSTIRKRGNRYVLSFRSIDFSNLFLNVFNISSGDKSKIVDIPEQYRNSKFEKYFWQGYLDGDGSIARKSRKLSAESMSRAIIDSFADYLSKKDIFFSKYKSKRGEDVSYVIVIRSISFRDFADKIGFVHPLKSKLLKEKLKDSDFYKKNDFDAINLLDTLTDYTKIFDKTAYLVNGRELLVKYGGKDSGIHNVPLYEVISLMRKFGLSNKEIQEQLSRYRFKKSKGSTNSVTIPLVINKDIIKLTKFVRLRDGGISFSKNYTESFNEEFNEVLKLTEDIFDIKPIYTCKNEPIFCSGILNDFFRYLLKK